MSPRRRGRPRGTGKPLKPPEERRSESITLRLTAAEFEAIRKAARGRSLGELIRERIFSVTESLTPPTSTP